MTQVQVQVDSDLDLLQALTALRNVFTQAGVTVTKADVQNWLAGIGGITTMAQWQAYEKKASLLLIECLIAVARRL